MGWEWRGEERYYYRSRKMNGRTVKEYLGCGHEAVIAAACDFWEAKQRARERQQHRQTLSDLDQLDARLEHIDSIGHLLVITAMHAAGFHWHRGKWRKQRMSNANEQLVPAADTPASGQPTINDLLNDPDLCWRWKLRAQTGDRDALRLLLSGFDQLKLMDTYGDVAANAINLAIATLVGNDALSEEAIQRKMNQLRSELAGPNPTALEKLLVDRVAVMWFHLHTLERECTMHNKPGSTRVLLAYQQAISTAQKRYFSAIRELTAIRRQALPALQVNVA